VYHARNAVMELAAKEAAYAVNHRIDLLPAQ